MLLQPSIDSFQASQDSLGLRFASPAHAVMAPSLLEVLPYGERPSNASTIAADPANIRT